MLGKILVGTDFSTRSDRALRRATLLARQANADLVLAHIIDNDRPLNLVRAEEREAAALLDELSTTTVNVDGVRCDFRLAPGEPFEEIHNVATAVGANVIVMGPHRRQALRDIFIGTTVERTIRRTRHPVLMANAPPTEGYHRALIAVDLSEGSADWVKAALDLGLIGDAETTVLHAFRSLAQFARVRSALNSAEAEVQIEEDRRRAESQLNDFLESAAYAPTRREVRLNVAGEATTINEYASAMDSDLIVLGTRQRTGPAKVILGSVAEEVLRTAQRDVLVIPVSRDGEPAISSRDMPS